METRSCHRRRTHTIKESFDTPRSCSGLNRLWRWCPFQYLMRFGLRDIHDALMLEETVLELWERGLKFQSVNYFKKTVIISYWWKMHDVIHITAV